MINPMTYFRKRKEKEQQVEIENKTERILNAVERKAVISTIKMSHQALIKLKTKVVENDEDKKRLINFLEAYNSMMDIEDENGKPYTKEDYKKMTGAELTQLLWDAQKYAAKNLLTKEETEKIFGKNEDD